MIEFSTKEQVALKTLGLPTSVDEILNRDEESIFQIRETIIRELLDEGLESGGMDLNEYGEALRDSLDTMVFRDREISQSTRE